MEKILINEPFITMTQLLKLKDYIASGGQAKYFILENQIFLNGLKVTERGKKLRDGDQVKIKNKLYLISYDQIITT